MANVTATDKFRDDPRFDTAGVLLEVDGDLVRMKMIRLWSWQTEHYTDEAPTYVVDRVTIVGMFKLTGAPDALVDVGLAEPRDGGFYIKGTEGEIEWLWNIRKAGQKGGRARAARAKSSGRVGGRFVASTKATPSSHQATTKQPPSNHQATDQADTSIRDPGSGIRDPNEEKREREPAAPVALALSHPEPAKPDPIADLWAEQTRLRAEAIPGSRPLSLTADRRKAIAALIKAGHTVDDLRVCLVQYATRAKVEPDSAQWFDGVSNWRPDNVTRALGKVGSARGRDGPAGTANHPAAPRFTPITAEDL